MNSYYHHLGAVAAAPTPRPDQLRIYLGYFASLFLKETIT